MHEFFDDEEPKTGKGAPMWVVTFGDMMSLLLCFFVLLLSFSEMDKEKYKSLAESLGKSFGTRREIQVWQMPKNLTSITQEFDQEIIEIRLRQELGKEIDDQLSSELEEFKDQIAMQSSEKEVVIRFMGESTFDSGKDEIKEKVKQLLGNVAKVIEKDGGDIIIAGHTDNVPIHGGPYPSNLRLSNARAAVVADYLIEHSNIDPRRISTMGFGEFRPIESNLTQRGREMNRRVEIILGGLQVIARQKPTAP